MSNEKPFGIRENRKAKGMTIKALAEAVGVNIRLLQKWEAGDTTPSVINARKVADALGVSLDDLY